MLGVGTRPARDLDMHIFKAIGNLGIPTCETVVEADGQVGPVGGLVILCLCTFPSP